MLERSSLVIRGRSDHTKKRQQVDILLKRAMKGERKAKLKLYKEFGIRVYSSEEVDNYVKERLSQEYAAAEKRASNGPTSVSRKKEARGTPRPRAKTRGKAKQPVRKA